MNLELERSQSVARAITAIGLVLIVGTNVACFALLNRDQHAFDVRLAKLESQMVVPEPTEAQDREASWRADERHAKGEELNAEIARCRKMGQTPVVYDGWDEPGEQHDWRLVCLQASSVAFQFEPEWPR